MTPEERQARIDDIFSQAIELDESERAQFLQRACKGEATEFRREVEDLHKAHDRAERETPLMPAMALPAVVHASKSKLADAMIDRQVGDFVLRRILVARRAFRFQH